MSLEGQHIGRYHLLHLLGSGGMGDVYLAEDARIEQQVAIKVIRTEASSYPTTDAATDAIRLFQREARAIAKLDHPNILPLFDYGEVLLNDMTLTYLVMPYRQEGSLASWLRQRNTGELLSLSGIVHIVRQAADALQHAHTRQIIHQDVKPSNFLLRYRDGNSALPDVLLADFGIARLTTATANASQSIRGTPIYMAPELWEGEARPATDQYALAVMTYELLTGRPPFQGSLGRMMYQHLNIEAPPPSAFNPRLSKEIDIVLLHALAKKTEMRFASITAFANAFQQAVQMMQGADTSSFAPKTLPVSSPVDAVPTQQPTVITQSGQQNAGSGVAQTEVQFAPPVGTASLPGAGGNQAIDHSARTEFAFPRNGGGAPPTVKNKRRPLLVIALVALVVLLIAGGIVYAAFGLLGLLPGTVSTSTVTITPASTDLKQTYTISAVTGTPDASKQQVQARQLTSITPAQTQTVQATGTATTSGTHATGTLTILNLDSTPATFNAGTVVLNENSPSIQMVLDAAVTIPGSKNGNNSTADVFAHVAQTGTIGNVIDWDHNGNTNLGFYNGSSYSCCAFYNLAPFTGGQNAGTSTVVKQSDIDGAANTLIAANTPNVQQVLQSKIQANEQLIGTPQCKPNVTSDHKVGDQAANVTVTVTFTCTGEVYDHAGALALAEQLLKQQAGSNPGSGYTLVGKVTTAITTSTVTQGTITLIVNAKGLWVFHFSDAQKQALAKLIAGKSKTDAQALLTAQSGVKQADITGSTLPTDPSQITIVVRSVSG